jgi:hypothetical protein
LPQGLVLPFTGLETGAGLLVSKQPTGRNKV